MPMRVGKELEAAVLRCEFNQIMDAKLKIKQALAEIGVFIFNKEKKEVLAKITGFFITLYTVLAGIFAIHLAVFVALTPSPGENIKPWNFGQYAYPNYPNTKIALVSHPEILTYKRSTGVAKLSQVDEKYIQRLLPSANASGVSSECLNETSQYGYSLGQPCIFVHVQRIHNWTPSSFGLTQTNGTMLVECSFTSSHVALNITSSMSGIPLNISNGIEGSFPFRGQNGFITPVMAIQLDLTSVPANSPPNSYQGTVTCRVDLDGMGLGPYTPESLSRDYDIPADGTIKIIFNK